MPNKYYQSKQWLTLQLKSKSAEEIAKACGVNKTTIYRYMLKFGLSEGTRSK